MNFGKLKAVVFILVFLLILALTAHWAMEMDAKRHPQPEPEETAQAEPTPPTAEETSAPAPAAPQQTWAPAPTPAPANRPAPTPAPQAPQQQNTPTAPTPVPTPEPRPAGQNLGSGSFRSETGTQLVLICDWSAVTVEGNKAEITLSLSIESATISLSDMGENIFVRVGDQSASLAQPVMSYEGGITRTTVGSRTLTVSLANGSSFPVAVEWHYNGSYNSVPLDVIECGGTIGF